AIAVPQTNVFEGQFHKNTDNFVICFFDDGRSILPTMGWRVHDEGDNHPNAAISSFSHSSTLTLITAEEAASMFDNNVTDFAPEALAKIYEEVWTVHAPHADSVDAEPDIKMLRTSPVLIKLYHYRRH
ncbi:hypothetical protein ACHAWF_003984, partial [Thalassiosira exigua]